MHEAPFEWTVFTAKEGATTTGNHRDLAGAGIEALRSDASLAAGRRFM
jgi:hypothetical protein